MSITPSLISPAFWEARLANLPQECPLPTVANRSPLALQLTQESWQTIDLGSAVAHNLERLGAMLQLDVETTAIGIWFLLLWRYRTAAPLVCCTDLQAACQLPLQVELQASMTVAQAVRQVQQAVQQAQNQAIAPATLLTIATNQGLTPADLWGLIGFSRGVLPVNTPLELVLWLSAGAVSLRYRALHLTAATAQRLAQHYGALVASLVTAGVDVTIAQVAYLPAAERLQLLHDWSGQGGDDRPLEDRLQLETIHQLFEARVVQMPDQIALIDGPLQLTYQQLNSRVNQLAHFLRVQGIGAEHLVALLLDRSTDLIVAFLAVLKAGAAYVPLDLTYPHERRVYKLRDAECTLILTRQDLLEQMPQGHASKVICLDQLAVVVARCPQTNPAPLATAQSLAYVLYTSGSTGNPKGVMIQHCGVVNHARAIAAEFELQPGDRMLQFSNIGFDIIVEEIYPTLISGATLVLRPESIAASTRDFWAFVEAQKISILDLPTAFWHELVSSLVRREQQLPDSLRLVCVGGEKASRTAYEQWRSRVPPHVRWINTYGPTEITVSATWCDPQKGGYTADQGDIPIGRPLPNVEVYVLDEQQQLLPVGVPGELCIGGPGVSRGYLNLPEATTTRFIVHPFNPDPQARLYRTGDVVRWREDGQLEYVGRSDFQVKIRGFRIEPGEIEVRLETHPQVQQTIVLAREVAEHKILVAYVVPQVDSGLTARDLGQWLHDKLPHYMVPSQFVLLPALPLTPNGKVDRRALPMPQAVAPGGSIVAIANSLEGQLIELWQEILGVPVGLDDDFFELGGHSLLVARLCDRLEQSLNYALSPTVLFRSPTVRQLAQCLQQDDGAATHHSSVLLIQRGSDRHPPLFAVHVLGEGGRFFRPLAQRLGSDQAVYGLAAQMMDRETAPPNRVEDLAAFYITEMQQVQPEGPYHIIGMSYGGTVAYEMARQMVARGLPVGMVALLDTYGPNLPSHFSKRAWLKAHWRSAQTIGKRRYVKQKLRRTWFDRREQLHCAYGRWLQRLGKSLSYELQYKLVVAENTQASNRYEPGMLADRLVLFRATEEVFYSAAYLEQGLGWGPLVDRLEVYDVPGDHMTMVEEPQVQKLAEALQQAMGLVPVG